MDRPRWLAGRLLVAVVLLALAQPLGLFGGAGSGPRAEWPPGTEVLGPVVQAAVLAPARSELQRRGAGGREQHRSPAFTGLALAPTGTAVVAVLLLWLAALAGTVRFLGSSSRRTTLSRGPPPLPVT